LNKGVDKMASIATISFRKSKSKLYTRAVLVASMFPSYVNSENGVCCSIDSTKDFIKVQDEFSELIHIVAKWKSVKITLLGKEYKGRSDLRDFYSKIKDNAGKYAIMIRDPRTTVSLAAITYEDLPLPVVFYPNIYGAFFAFAKDVGEDIYFCECERQAITNYVKLRSQMPLSNYANDKVYPLGGDYFPPIVAQMSLKYKDSPLKHIRFKENLCFRCNKKVPKMTYCHPMYGGQFKQHFGWYIQQEYFNLGIDPYQICEANVLPEECNPQIYDNILRIAHLSQQNQKMQSHELHDKIKKLYDENQKSIENSVRVQLGYRKIGDSWISETILFHIVESLYPEKEILRHYRPKWLEGLELDIFVPEEKLAFEYQGIQHFIAVERWGGQKQLEKQREHDARKKRLCKEFEIRLICINYDDPLTNEFVENVIINAGCTLF
jgi:hypothetical protein